MSGTEHKIKVWPFGGFGHYAGCSCGWSGTVYGRKLDASEDGKSHTLMYAWEPTNEDKKMTSNQNRNFLRTWERRNGKTIPASLLLWDQAVEVLRRDDYKVTQSSRNYAISLASVGLGSPVDELEDVHPDCDCVDCTKAEKEYERMDAYREFRDLYRGGGA